MAGSGRIYPFAEPSGNARSLRIAVVRCVVIARMADERSGSRLRALKAASAAASAARGISVYCDIDHSDKHQPL